MSTHETHIDVQRRIAADPTSAVLLLAAPAAAELWPGVRVQAAQPGDHIQVEVHLPAEAAALVDLPDPVTAVIRAESPQRTPTSFVLRFSFDAADVPVTTGTLTLSYAPADDEEAIATVARLTFTVASAYAARGFVRALEMSARTFLDNVATEAEARSRAA